MHATVRYTPKGFVLEDYMQNSDPKLRSKFGTLLLLRGKQELPACGLTVQVNQTMVIFNIKEGKKDESPFHSGLALSGIEATARKGSEKDCGSDGSGDELHKPAEAAGDGAECKEKKTM